MTNGKDSHSKPNWAGFGGYSSPNFTPVPDQLFDEQLAYLSGAELKVLLYIMRRTFGFKKESDNISLSQMLNGIERRDGTALDRGVGLSKKTLLQALRDLQEKNLIFTARRRSQERGNEPTCYSLHMASAGLAGKTTPPLGEKLHQGGGEESPPSPRGENSPIQETASQETVLQDIDPSNIRKASTQKKKQRGEGPHDQSPEPIQSAITRAPHGRGAAPQLSESRSGGLSSVAEALARRTRNQGPTGNLRRQRTYSEARQRILAYVQDFAIELGDEASLTSSVTRAFNLYRHSGVPLDVFTSRMYEARSLTQEYSANITKQKHPAAGEKSIWGPGKNKMAYWFSVLEELLQLDDDDAADITGERASP